MSTVTYRDEVMAADTRAYTGSCPPIGEKVKTLGPINGYLVGGSTNQPGMLERLFAWITPILVANTSLAVVNWEKPEPLKGELGKFTLLVVDKDERGWLFENTLFPSGPLKADYFAIGSGREYAMGAMAHGASAMEALRVACKFDVWSSTPLFGRNVRGERWEVVS